MSTPPTQIRCPNCGSPTQASLTQLVDVGQDPSAKARLLSGSLNQFQCATCGFQGQVASPLVYHDPDEELLLTYIPVEIGMPKDEQDRVIGQLINRAINALEPEQRKGYLFQPHPVLTMQSLIERVLEADGITKEEIDAQRAKLRLFEQLLRTPEESIPDFVSEHDDELDSGFFQIALLSLQSTPDAAARETANEKIQAALERSSYGKEIMAQEAEIRSAAESLQAAGEGLTHESLLQIFIDAPNDERVKALVQFIRPALDYTFFQRLTERIDAAEGDEKERLIRLRKLILDQTQEIDKAQEVKATEAAALLRELLEAEDLDQAIRSALPRIDEFFLGILRANIRSAMERKDQQSQARLENVDQRIRAVIRESLPPGLQVAQDLLDIEDPEEARAFLEESADAIDDELLNALLTTAQRLEGAGNSQAADRIKDLHRTALRLSMKSKLKKSSEPDKELDD